MEKNKKAKTPAVPSLDKAMECIQANADRSMLPQIPYADLVDGYGWVIDSVCCGSQFPSNAKHFYEVAVIPKGFWN